VINKVTPATKDELKTIASMNIPLSIEIHF